MPTNKKRVSVTLSKKTEKEVKELAENMGIGMSTVFLVALNEYVKNNKK